MSDKRTKNGYSIVEVVIALSVIIAVSISAITIALSSSAAKSNAIAIGKGIRFAENIKECFKAAQDEEEFISYVGFAEGIDLTKENLDSKGKTVYTCSSKDGDFSSLIAVSYDTNAEAEISVTVTDNDGGEIVSFDYIKGGGT